MLQHKGAVTGKADYAFHWYTSTRADPDNIAFAKKFILDGLQMAGVIENDNQKHVGRLSDVIEKSKVDRVVVTITPSEEGDE